jgi:hypothetical protein
MNVSHSLKLNMNRYLLRLPVVEHTTAPSDGLTHGALPLPQLRYEGFEPSPYEAGDSRPELEELSGPVSFQLTTLSRKLTLRIGRKPVRWSGIR